ncbi:hypothetical protein MNEG_8425 [Monoraphidium neglectum]|uniref:EF-hand domain-containing protein n=1 Tax=Monoraphidium neglectum TaxID=145388 RepID=A0A0D2JJR3_9CHLO|nr:hypothetical protein MNEG_8425 [Monoraphidium neglectum]KIY99537.1 hypothetical protein MNEG_8425 [Monoraphidium neglectum]|eukprot:XP_013898557.1 hypothetical protein MNEG_8425 [Monoraphidium neglectum]
MSSLEKTYEYFATQTDAAGAKAMDVRDVVRAVVPTYPASDGAAERAGFLDGERGQVVQGSMEREPRGSTFRVLDDDGDGVISFQEFRLVVLLLSIPEADIQVVFSVIDLDDSGSISIDEFDVVGSNSGVLSELERRAGLQARFHSRAGKHDNVGACGPVPDAKAPGNIAKALFGKNLRGGLDLKRFKAFLHQLHADVTRLEFSHYDVDGDGYIRGLDFGMSIAGAADIKSADCYLDKARRGWEDRG